MFLFSTKSREAKVQAEKQAEKQAKKEAAIAEYKEKRNLIHEKYDFIGFIRSFNRNWCFY